MLWGRHTSNLNSRLPPPQQRKPRAAPYDSKTDKGPGRDQTAKERPGSSLVKSPRADKSKYHQITNHTQRYYDPFAPLGRTPLSPWSPKSTLTTRHRTRKSSRSSKHLNGVPRVSFVWKQPTKIPVRRNIQRSDKREFFTHGERSHPRNKIFSFAAVRSLLLSLLSDKTGNSLSHAREVEKKRDPN